METVAPGSSVQNTMTLYNYADANVSGINFAVSGAIAPYVSLASLPSALANQESDALTVTFTVPAGLSAQTFSGLVDVNTAQGFAEQAALTLTVPQSVSNLDVSFYGDASHLTPQQAFIRGDTIYYLIQAFDQTGAGVNATGLDANIVQPDGSSIQSIDNQSMPLGNYSSLFDSNTGMDAGTYLLQASLDYYGMASDSNSFTLDSEGGGSMAQCMYFDWGTSAFNRGGYDLEDWNIGNKCDGILPIVKMTVSGWSANDLDGALLERIELHAERVYNGGNGTDGQLLDTIDFGIPAFTSYASTNELRFSKKVNDNSEDFRIRFEFSDGSSYTTVLYSP